jgi:hypothetical protein
VTAIVTKRDEVLSSGIMGAIARGLPIDDLSSAKRDYQDKGKLANVVGRRTKQQVEKSQSRRKELMGGANYRDKATTKRYNADMTTEGKRMPGEKYVRRKPGPVVRDFSKLGADGNGGKRIRQPNTVVREGLERAPDADSESFSSQSMKNPNLKGKLNRLINKR